MKKVLFVCIHNSARSQIAEALLRKYGGGLFTVESAGYEPAEVNPLAVEALKDEEIDISLNSSDSVFDFFRMGKQYNYVITVCDEEHKQKCPIFPGLTFRIHWDFEDPSSFTGEYETKVAKTKEIKEEIKKEVLNFIDLVKNNKLSENSSNVWRVN